MAQEPRLILDDKKAWSNLPVALVPAAVGIWLLVCPFTTELEAAVVAPIMLPFALAWLVLAFCISAYHSFLTLDHDRGEVVYTISLFLHSWSNKVRRGNVSEVVIEPIAGKYRFLMRVIEGEDLTVTTSDYWRCREWAERVAEFLEVSLVDDCRDPEESASEDLRRTLSGEIAPPYPAEKPEGISVIQGPSETSIILPARGLLKSDWPQLTAALGLLGLALYSQLWWVVVLALVAGLALCFKPLSRATHWEEIQVTNKGIVAKTTVLGRSQVQTFDKRGVRRLNLVGPDARHDHDEFDRHAVCLESNHGHLQLGAHLPEKKQLDWLQQVLLHLICSGDQSSKKI